MNNKLHFSTWKILLFVFLICFIAIIWREIIFSKSVKNAEIYFLNVGQGDSELIVLPNNVKILIDGGPGDKVLNELSQNLSFFDRYIDLVILSHPETDHFSGLIGVLKNYKVGAFIYNGRAGVSKSFSGLKNVIEENKIPTVVLAESDKIKYLDNKFKILSPGKKLLSGKDTNDSSLVIRFENKNISALFTGDIGKNAENYIFQKYDLKSDILKIPHHGSKYSSADEFIKEVNPKISVIEVGKNSYGHPTPIVISRLKEINSQIFRTDLSGTIKIVLEASKLNIFSQR